MLITTNFFFSFLCFLYIVFLFLFLSLVTTTTTATTALTPTEKKKTFPLMSILAESIIQTLNILQQATALDFAGEAAQAAAMYASVNSRLDELMEVLPADQAEIVRRHVEEIKRKQEMLRHAQWVSEQKSIFPQFDIAFTPMPTPVEEFRVPRDAIARVYWLMRRLSTSMQQGAYLTPNLYVPKDVWHQAGASDVLKYIQAKTKYLSALCEATDPLLAVNTLGDFAKTIKLLKKFVEQEGELRASLDHDTGRRKDAKQKKSVWSKMFSSSKKTQGGDVDVLLTWVVNAFEQCQLFGRWYVYFMQAAHVPNVPEAEVREVLSLLKTVTFQLYDGPCVYILRDMAVLVERFEEKSCKSASKLLPMDIKLEGDTSTN